jgi:hypothetical protein
LTLLSFIVYNILEGIILKKGRKMLNDISIIESSINSLLEQLDMAIAEQDDVKVNKIGETIENLLNELNGDVIKLRILQ